MIGFGKTSLDLTLTNRFLGVVGTGACWRLGRGEGLSVRRSMSAEEWYVYGGKCLRQWLRREGKTSRIET